MRGWISLHRKILDNPILKASKEYSRLEAFVWLLLRANHKEGKCVIGSTLYKVKKGEMITSQMKLMKQFRWSKSKLINFLKLLQEDEMIDMKTEPNLTRITILNYCTYQDYKTTKKPLTDREKTTSRPEKDTNNNGNKDGKSVFEYLSYTQTELRQHLESLFTEGMSWDNWAKDGWHIDHIYPQSKLPYDSMIHHNFQKAWELENLQPMWALENISKGNKI